MRGEGAKIFAAEVHGKRSPNDIKEDELTSRFLGVFANLTPVTQFRLLDNLGLSKGFESHKALEVELWPRLEGPEGTRELDAIVRQGDQSIGMEFKWESEGTEAQLLEERRLLPSEDLLVYITRDGIIPPAVTTARKRLGGHSGSIEWVPWRAWLRAAIDTVETADDSRDTSLLRDVINLLKVVGVTDWQRGLNEFWKASSNEAIIEAYHGLRQFFLNLGTRLKSEHSEDYRVGDAQTIFAWFSYVEFTPTELTRFAENLALYVYLHHGTQKWELTFQTKHGTHESAQRARDVLESVKSTDLPLGKDDTVASRSFVPDSDFSSPDRLADEIEAALIEFANELSEALRHSSR